MDRHTYQGNAGYALPPRLAVAPYNFIPGRTDDQWMKKVIVLFICIVLLLVMSGCSQPQSAQGQSATPTPTPIKTIAHPTTSQPITAWTLQPQTPTPSVLDNTISIASMAFNPPSLTIKKGSIVRWVNNDAVAHTVIFTKQSGITCGTGIMSSAQSCSVKFDEPGTYTYTCSIHPSMQGTIVVV